MELADIQVIQVVQVVMELADIQVIQVALVVMELADIQVYQAIQVVQVVMELADIQVIVEQGLVDIVEQQAHQTLYLLQMIQVLLLYILY